MPRRSTRQTTQTYRMGPYDVQLTRKRVRNINLRIGPDGSVRVSAPHRVPLAEIESFVLSKASWIEKAIDRSARQSGRFDLCCEEGAEVLVWGAPFACHIICEEQGLGRKRCIFELIDGKLVAHVRPELAGSDEDATARRTAYLANWLADLVVGRAEELVPIWEDVVGRTCSAVRIRPMKTRWGSCNVRTGAVTLNAHLVHLDPRCLEYVICHELCHLHEPSHNKRFHSLMDRFYPSWREVRKRLEGRD